MYQRYFKAGLFGVIAILFIYTNAYAISHFDPYKLAENRITETISENSKLIGRLTVYGQQANEWRENIKLAVGPSHFVVNNKDEMTTVVSFFKVKSGIFIVESVHLIAQQILILDEELGKISNSIELSTDFARLIESDSYLSKEEHRMIMAHIRVTKSGLIGAGNELQAVSERLRTLFSNSNFEKTRAILCIIPPVCNALQAWEDLPDTLDQILEPVASDINTLEIITSQYEVSATIDKSLDRLLIRPLAQRIIASKILLFTLLICLTSGIYGWVKTPSIRQSWSNWISKSKNTIAGKMTNQVYPNGFSKPVNFRTDEKFSNAKNNNRSIISLTQGIKNRQTQALLVCNFVESEHYIVGVPDIGKLTIGSNPLDDVLTSSSESAKSQLILKHAITVFYLEVLDCSFPTKVNGQIVTGGRKLNTGDTITVGDLSAIYLEHKQRA